MTFQHFHRIRQWCGEEKGEERVSGKGRVYSPLLAGELVALLAEVLGALMGG